MTTIRIRGMRRSNKAQIEADTGKELKIEGDSPVEIYVHGELRAIVHFPGSGAPKLAWSSAGWAGDMTAILLAAADTSRKLSDKSKEKKLW